MTTNELLAILGGLALGYRVVGSLLGGREGARPRAAPSRDPHATGPRGPRPAPPPPPADQEDDWWVVLGLARTAEVPEIRTAYWRLMSRYHPDKVATLGPELIALAERKSKTINLAYQQALAARGAR